MLERFSCMARVYSNLPPLKPIRRSLRSSLTSAEIRLWQAVKGKQLGGRKFRRQHSMGPYVLDFFCPAEKLAVELDGAAHDSAARPISATRAAMRSSLRWASRWCASRIAM